MGGGGQNLLFMREAGRECQNLHNKNPYTPLVITSINILRWFLPVVSVGFG